VSSNASRSLVVPGPAPIVPGGGRSEYHTQLLLRPRARLANGPGRRGAVSRSDGTAAPHRRVEHQSRAARPHASGEPAGAAHVRASLRQRGERDTAALAA